MEVKMGMDWGYRWGRGAGAGAPRGGGELDGWPRELVLVVIAAAAPIPTTTHAAASSSYPRAVGGRHDPREPLRRGPRRGIMRAATSPHGGRRPRATQRPRPRVAVHGRRRRRSTRRRRLRRSTATAPVVVVPVPAAAAPASVPARGARRPRQAIHGNTASRVIDRSIPLLDSSREGEREREVEVEAEEWEVVVVCVCVRRRRRRRGGRNGLEFRGGEWSRVAWGWILCGAGRLWLHRLDVYTLVFFFLHIVVSRGGSRGWSGWIMDYKRKII